MTQPDLHSFRNEELPIMNRLPQTKDEYRDLRQHYKIMSRDQGLDGVMQKEHGREKEPPIAPMVENLLTKNLKQKTV